MTSTPTGAVRYRCPCGAEYLVAIRASASDEAWLETVRVVARSLGLRAVDGSRVSFVCETCGRTRLRED